MLKQGDVVTLNSGGEPMTVQAVKVICVSMVNGEVKQAELDANMLKAVDVKSIGFQTNLKS